METTMPKKTNAPEQLSKRTEDVANACDEVLIDRDHPV
jgi:hypothetical protein